MKRTRDHPQGDAREWEAFVRSAAEEPLCHVGSVSAPDADAARERAETLFGHAARDLWLCPAGEVRRYAAETLAERGES